MYLLEPRKQSASLLKQLVEGGPSSMSDWGARDGTGEDEKEEEENKHAVVKSPPEPRGSSSHTRRRRTGGSGERSPSRLVRVCTRRECRKRTSECARDTSCLRVLLLEPRGPHSYTPPRFLGVHGGKKQNLRKDAKVLRVCMYVCMCVCLYKSVAFSLWSQRATGGVMGVISFK